MSEAFSIRLDSKVFVADGYRSKITSFPVHGEENEVIESLGLWARIDGELTPLLVFPFQIDEQFYIRLAPRVECNCNNPGCCARQGE